jgi:uncharacterized protein DUF4389
LRSNPSGREHGLLRLGVLRRSCVAGCAVREPLPKPLGFEVERSGTPTAGSALLRIVKAIPSAIVLLLLAFVPAIVWLVVAVWISGDQLVIKETYPKRLFNYQPGVVRWEARLLAYLASVV